MWLKRHLSALSLVSPHQSVVPSICAEEVIKQLSASVRKEVTVGTEEEGMWNGNEKTKT